MNIDLLQKVKQAILANPDRFDMDRWAFGVGVYPYGEAKFPECGTTCCMGGWAAAVWNRENPDKTPVNFNDGMRVLGLNIDQAIVYYWPREFAERYEFANSNIERSIAAADYIDYLIAGELA